MSNQHRGKPSFHTCDNPECGKKVRITPHMVRKGAGKYCSPECGWKCKTRTKYPTDTIKWIQKHILHVSMDDIAEMIGVTRVALGRAVTKMRSEGWDIPKANTVPVGTIADRKQFGRPFQQIKTEYGWKNYTPDGLHGSQKGKATRIPAIKSIEFKPDMSVIPVACEVANRTMLLFPDGRKSVICDSDKVDATIRYLLKSG